MATLTRLSTVLGLAAIGALLLSSCSLLPSDSASETKKTSAPVEAEASVAAEAPASDDKSEAVEAPAASPSSDIAAPGAKFALGEWATYDFVNYDETKSVISSRPLEPLNPV